MERGSFQVLKKAAVPVMAAAMMITAVIFVPGIISRYDTGILGPGVTRIKGEPGISVYRKQGDQAELLRDRARVFRVTFCRYPSCRRITPMCLYFLLTETGL